VVTGGVIPPGKDVGIAPGKDVGIAPGVTASCAPVTSPPVAAPAPPEAGGVTQERYNQAFSLSL